MVKSRVFSKFIIFALVAIVLFSVFYISKVRFGNKKRFPKVIIIGVDAATWQVIDALIEKNKLPNIRKLMNTGTHGRFLSNYPTMISPVVWTSIATGKRPDKHGITDFLCVNQPVRATPVTSDLRKTKAIWNILSEVGLKVAVVGWSTTWPAEIVNGYMVSDMALHRGRDPYDVTFPKQLVSILQSEGFFVRGEKENDVITIQFAQKIMGLDGDVSRQFLAISRGQERNKDIDIVDIPGLIGSYNTDKFNLDVSMYLLKNFDIDFLAVYLNGTDRAEHQLWKYMIGREDEFPSTQNERQIYGERITACFKEVTKNYYCWVDEAVGRILKFTGPDTHIVIVSDHGMKFCSSSLRVSYQQTNELLQLLGLLEFKPNLRDIDFSKTMIYDGCYFLYKDAGKFFINLKGRQPQGIVEEEDYEALRDNFVEFLKDIKVNGENVFNILKIRDLDEGLADDSERLISGDIVVDIKSELLQEAVIEFQGKRYRGSKFIRKDINSGAHDEYGILIWKGPNVRKNNKEDRYCYLDITPTLLYTLNQPIAEDMDGKIMRSLFTQRFLERNPISSIYSYDNQGSQIKQWPSKSTTETDEFILEGLKSLGYIQ